MAQPGDPVLRDLEPVLYPEVNAVSNLKVSTPEEFKKWSEELGFPCDLTPMNELDDVESEDVIYHSPEFLDAGRFEASWALITSTRKALHMPYPLPQIPVLYEIQSQKGKGLCMVAKYSIEAGYPILFEHPLVMFPRVFRGIPIPSSTESMLKIVVDRLEEPFKKKFLSLRNCKTAEEAGPIGGILRTNALGATLSGATIKEWGDYLAVPLDISHARHSCSPNAAYAWNEKTYSFILYALQPISRGEEICISFTSTEEPRDLRQRRLKAIYKFDCMCSACHPSDARSILQSDERRQIVKHWHEEEIYQFEDWVHSEDNAKALLKAWWRVIEAHEKEGLAIPFKALYTMTMMHYALGHRESFEQWAEQLAGAMRIQAWKTMDSRYVDGLRSLLFAVQNPHIRSKVWGCKAL